MCAISRTISHIGRFSLKYPIEHWTRRRFRSTEPRRIIAHYNYADGLTAAIARSLAALACNAMCVGKGETEERGGGEARGQVTIFVDLLTVSADARRTFASQTVDTLRDVCIC